MAEELLNAILSAPTEETFEPNFAQWFLNTIQKSSKISTVEEFGLFFLNFLRQQTEEYTKAAATPKCVNTPVTNDDSNIAEADLSRSTSSSPTLSLSSTSDRGNKTNDSLQIRSPSARKNDSLNQSFHKGNTSTPHKNFNKSNNSVDLNRSSNSSFCLGDFIVVTHRKKRKQNNSANKSDTNTPDSKSAAEKPKKRVVPTKVNKSAPGAATSFTNPAFNSDSKVLQIFNEAEIVEKENCAVMEARKSLKTNIVEINRELEEENKPEFLNRSLREALKRMEKIKRKNSQDMKMDLTKLEDRNILDRLAEIYSLLIDSHITANVLSELSYLLSILNAEPQIKTKAELKRGQSDEKVDDENPSEMYTVFKKLPNCIYFALEVLKRQKHLLALLDVRTLRVVLNNERINEHALDLHKFLDTITVEKMQLEARKSSYETSFRINKPFNNVSYQAESDTRSNFPSDREFNSFKSQRDDFYAIFKIWDANHLNHTWNFKEEMTSKVAALFHLSNHPINMAHLARLFVAQLLVSSNYSESSTDIEAELKAHVDEEKFSKLTQRLVEPSSSSTDYQFPAKQAFFKDFLTVSTCVSFIEQVKIGLLAELLQFNNSTYEIINLTPNENSDFVKEYVVRPEILSTMQVLAKFIGLLQSQPFAYTPASGCSRIEEKQIKLRNVMQPNFDVLAILKAAVRERKLLIVIPWVVQYLAMLDSVTLRLDCYKNTLNLLYELYICLGGRPDIMKMRPTSTFILKTCLGWFFEDTNVAESYYAYRQNRTLMLSHLIEMREISVLVPNALASELANNEQKPMIVRSIQHITEQGVHLALEEFGEKQEIQDNQISSTHDIGQFDPMLECILNVACPFLSEFRVSILPAKYSKCVSRTGRYRHVTPKVTEITTTASPRNRQHLERYEDSQSKLVDAFLHSQNLSVRRIIEFVIERVTSAVIKDAQMEILLPRKDAGKKEVDDIRLFGHEDVRQLITDIYTKANEEALIDWDKQVPKMTELRVKMALDALLPHETHDAVKRTCQTLILQKCRLKINDWRNENLKGIDFYVSDVSILADKIENKNAREPFINDLEIVVSTPALSDVIEDLQYWLHATSRRPELVQPEKIKKSLVELRKTFVNVLPRSFYCLVGKSTVHLIKNLIENHSETVTVDLINHFIDIWTSERMLGKELVNVPDDSKDDDEMINKEREEIKQNLFSELIRISFVRSLQTDDSFDKLELFLTKLVEHNLITFDRLNDLFVQILKEDWDQKVLNRISTLLQNVAAIKKQPELDDDGRPKLFMKVLANITRDIDF